jgi:transcriptional regulator with XRE-family HTH domain
MNMADRIQSLRKTKGISQEELAAQIGVSRQAVSKWESEQSSPDIEKVILLSDFFEVTTDYLLKGIEPYAERETSPKVKPNANIFSIVGTAFNLIGILVAAMLWIEEQKTRDTAGGLIFTIMGCMIYGIGMVVSDETTKIKAKRMFLSINIWTILFIPLSVLYNYMIGVKGCMVPYPMFIGDRRIYVLFWAIYITICVVFNFVIRKWTRLEITDEEK